jgi:3-deoxy-D-manno-octulosonic-acid transferase
MLKWVYDAAFAVFAACYLPFFMVRLRQEKNKKRLIGQRFGFFSKELFAGLAGRNVIWLHAVSVGEVFAARPLVAALSGAFPEWRIAVSTVTPTGQAVARKIFPDLAIFYLPFDLSAVVRRTLDRIRPSLLLLMETELWPNLILGAAERNIPIGVVNGRLSPKSHRRYKQIRRLFEGVLEKISFFLVQSQWDSDRLEEIGVPPRAIRITGNMKFDIPADVKPEDVQGLRGRYFAQAKERVLVAGSTHEGEEIVLLKVLRRLRFEFPDLKLVVAPRHVTRTADIVRLAESEHFRWRLFSSNAGPVEDVLILDTMGELKKWYSVADFVFIGGSLVKHGGQNPIEAAIFKKPVLFGPHVFNFAVVYEALGKAGAGFEVYNETELYDFLRRMLLEPAFARQAGNKAYELIRGFQGAAERNCDFIRQFLRSRESGRREAAEASVSR